MWGDASGIVDLAWGVSRCDGSWVGGVSRGRIRREGAVSTAINRTRLHASPLRRVVSYALAGTLAVSALMPGFGNVIASDGATATPSSSFSVSVDTVEELTGLTAIVSGGGDGVNLRADAAHDAEVVAAIPEGDEVTLRIDTLDTVVDADGITRWWPVTYDGIDGWVSGFYLTDPNGTTDADVSGASADDATSTATTTSSAAPTPTQTPFTFDGEVVAGIEAQVNGGGEPVNLRDGTDVDSGILDEVPDGTIVTLRIDTVDTVTDDLGIRWWPVTVAGQDGWIAGNYLIAVGGDEATTFAVGSYVRIKTESGEGARVRAEAAPDGEVLTTWNESQVAQVMEGPVSFENSVNGWYKLTNGGVTGFVDGDLLVAAPQAAATSTATTAATFASGDRAVVTTERGEGVNVRERADPASERVGYAPESAVVTIVSGPESFTNSTNGWYEITYNDVTGFVDGDLLVKTEAEPTATTATDGDGFDGEGEFGAYTKGDYVIVDTNSGVGVNVRESPAPDATVTGFLAESAAVQVIDGPMKDSDGNVWYRVTNGGDTRGWVAGNLFVDAEGQAPTTSDSATVAAESTTAPVTPTPTSVATTASTAQPTSAPTTEPTVAAAEAETSSTGFIYPLDSYTATQEFGCSTLGFYTVDPTLGCPFHDGLDLAAAAGTPIHASAAGTVVAAGWCDCGLGYYVEIDHGDGVHTLYGHMQSQPYVSVGQTVAQGETIGPLGSTGLSTGPHTHFMVTIDGVAQNPRNYLP